MQIYNSKVLYLIAGANGSGKTTLAREIVAENPDIEFLNPDDIQRENNVDAKKAGRMVLQRMKHLFSTHDSFIYETTLSGNNNYIKQAREIGYKIIFVYVVLASVEQNVARVKQRFALGGHDVPEDVIRRRYYRSLSNVDSVCKNSDEWKIYDNSNDKYELIVQGIGDKINVINNPRYREFIENRGKILSEHLLELGRCAAKKARLAAINAGVPIADVQNTGR
ncbi:MAG: zeta toxin family protein [Alphaproteobacteria bacterium]|nr:zeta toxin family protein [Alphaproteobacteria bacterium]